LEEALMGADNQAEKIIDRIERMKQLIAENEKLKTQFDVIIDVHRTELEYLKVEIERLKTENEWLQQVQWKLDKIIELLGVR
jgi:hypothetical protein